MKRFIFFSVIILIILGSCSRRPRYVIPEKKMIDVLVDIQLAQAIYGRNNQFTTDEKKDALIEGVLKKHKVSQAELDSSLVWYADNIQYYETITDSVASKLRARSSQFSAYMNATAKRGINTTQYLPPYYYLNEYTPTLSFDIDSFRIKNVEVPKFKIRFDVQGLSDLDNVEAAFYYRYKDTVVKEIVPIAENRRYTFSRPNLSDSLLKSISGYIHLNNKIKELPTNIMLYNINYIDSTTVETPRDSVDYILPSIPSSADSSTETAVESVAVEEAEVAAEAMPN